MILDLRHIHESKSAVYIYVTALGSANLGLGSFVSHWAGSLLVSGGPTGCLALYGIKFAMFVVVKRELCICRI